MFILMDKNKNPKNKMQWNFQIKGIKLNNKMMLIIMKDQIALKNYAKTRYNYLKSINIIKLQVQRIFKGIKKAMSLNETQLYYYEKEKMKKLFNAFKQLFLIYKKNNFKAFHFFNF